MNKTLLIISTCLLLGGCGDSGARRDNAEENNPQIRKGVNQAKLKQWDRAIRSFEKALSENEKQALPDLELALIYHQQKKNYVRAIYHYQRYLEKCPDSQKRPLILDWIQQAKISLAAEIGQNSGDISDEIIRLTRKNNLLRKQLERTAVSAPTVANVRTILTDPPQQNEPEPEPIDLKPIPKPKPTPVSLRPIARIQTPAPIPETYTVLPGDTLSKIARTIYGDSGKWKDIYSANLDKMKNENDLRAGQTIRLPKLGN